ncbi:MAG: hypothetical protein PUB62_01370 [Prevotellaceae bacterium]|nr:hypothetical protein [Prevotellaceae bacterium]MDY6098483.1 hypothetical protein [Bacteroidaceae bacterium]
MRDSVILTAMGASLLMLVCCKPQEDPRHQEVRQAAELYCSHLISQQPDSYVEGLYGYTRMAPEKQSQLRDAAAQFAHTLSQGTNRPLSVRATADSLWQDSAIVFLDVLFADSTTESIMLPLLREEGQWKVR